MTAIACLRWIAYVLLIGSVVPAGLSIPQFLKSRRAKYYGIRRQALQRALRRLLIMGIMQAVAILLLVVCPLLQRGATPSTPGATVTPTNVPVGTTRSSTATPRPTAAPTAVPTQTPSPTPTATAVPEPRITFRALSTEVSRGQPVDPGDTFPPGDYRLYVFFRYQEMRDGLETTANWYKDGEAIDFCSDTWSWGLDEDYAFGGANGASLIYCKIPGGWEPGNYEVRFLIEDRLQFLVEFVITE
ncbi:MAG: hypothetical protein JXA14_19935 [Anaerolineae bacterium]|nr:hypothetical protein [Anaerolineae bacterium]